MLSLTISETIQGSDEWLAERAGNISASCFKKIITPGGKRTTGDTRKKYLHQLAGERITGMPEDGFKSEWMTRGNEVEPAARLNFEERNELFVVQVGMVYLEKGSFISCSPDGLILPENIGLEIKCPKCSTHIGYLEEMELPPEYKQQVQGSMMVTGFEQWYFYSFYPGIKPMQLLIDRDEAYISLLREAVEEFDTEVDSLVERIVNNEVII